MIPRINPFRGATSDDCIVTAHEVQRITDAYLGELKALLNNLDDNLPLTQRLKISAQLCDVEALLSDIVNSIPEEVV